MNFSLYIAGVKEMLRRLRARRDPVDLLHRVSYVLRGEFLFRRCTRNGQVSATGFVRVNNWGEIVLGDQVTVLGGMIPTEFICHKGARLSIADRTAFSWGVTIKEVAVIGVDDEILGQAVKAFIVLEDGANISEKEILQVCWRKLESFMVPKYVEFVADLPKTNTGKIQKINPR